MLRRLQESEWVKVYDQPYQGRNRRYYHIIEEGKQHHQELSRQWQEFSQAIKEIVSGGDAL